MIMGTQTTKGRSMRLQYPTLHLSNTIHPLQLALHRPSAVIVQIFLSKNANPEHRAKQSRKTPPQWGFLLVA